MRLFKPFLFVFQISYIKLLSAKNLRLMRGRRKNAFRSSSPLLTQLIDHELTVDISILLDGFQCLLTPSLNTTHKAVIICNKCQFPDVRPERLELTIHIKSTL